MLSSQIFICLPCLFPPFALPSEMVLARANERETCPYHFSLRPFISVRWRRLKIPYPHFDERRPSGLVAWKHSFFFPHSGLSLPPPLPSSSTLLHYLSTSPTHPSIRTLYLPYPLTPLPVPTHSSYPTPLPPSLTLLPPPHYLP